jgi:hypothetical protein
VAILSKGKVQFLVLNREERKKERKFWKCKFVALEERIKTVCLWWTKSARKMCIEWRFICMVGPKRVSIARLFTCLRCRCRIRLLIRHLQKKSKTVGIVCCGLSFGAIQNRSRFVAANLDSNHRLVESEFSEGFCVCFWAEYILAKQYHGSCCSISSFIFLCRDCRKSVCFCERWENWMWKCEKCFS